MRELVGELLGGWDERRVSPARSNEGRTERPTPTLVEREIEHDVAELVHDHFAGRRGHHAHRCALSVQLLAGVRAQACLRPTHDVDGAVELG